ncbi:hypothetical protein BH10PSE7_BH10PSE7_23170 [soil metagenome]
MDWARAIEINQSALTRIVAALIAMVGLAAGGALTRLPRPVYRAALGVLRPAEAAVRRLIVIMARGVAVKPRPVRPMLAGRVLKARGRAATAFQLFDARKRFGPIRLRRAGPRAEPRIYFFSSDPLVPLFQPQYAAPIEVETAEPDDGMVGAEGLGRRLTALRMALENLPRQVNRLARWQARRDMMESPKFRSPLRPGRPPGYREEPTEEVHRVLRECHALARDALNDSS